MSPLPLNSYPTWADPSKTVPPLPPFPSYKTQVFPPLINVSTSSSSSSSSSGSGGGGKPTATVIFSHGLGDKVEAWEDLRKQCEGLGWVKWVFPQGPPQFITIWGRELPAWYDLTTFDGPVSAQNPANMDEEEASMLQAKVNVVDELIRKEIEEEGIPPERIVLGGFSQGAVLSCMSAFTSPHKLGGLFVLSGHLPFPTKLKDLAYPHSFSLPIFWATGTADDMISEKWAKMSVDFLKNELGVHENKITYKTYSGLKHEHRSDETWDVGLWLLKVLPRESKPYLPPQPIHTDKSLSSDQPSAPTSPRSLHEPPAPAPTPMTKVKGDGARSHANSVDSEDGRQGQLGPDQAEKLRKGLEGLNAGGGDK